MLNYSCLIFVLLIIVAFLYIHWSTTQRRRRLEAREELSDSQFLEDLCAAPDDATYILASRRVLAQMCGIAPQKLHPRDTPTMLASVMQSLTLDGWDPFYFVGELEQELGVTLDKGFVFEMPLFLGAIFPKKSGPATIGEWAKQLALFLRERSSTAQESEENKGSGVD